MDMETFPYSAVCCFENLYRSHLIARRGKRFTPEVINFELDLGNSLMRLTEELKNETYRISGYYSFRVYEPKERIIHALHYRDRVVQHCLCDYILEPLLGPKLIYDNAACRKGKGTHFAIRRLTGFLSDFYRKHGTQGYILRCDVAKFFDSVSHRILKSKMLRVVWDEKLQKMISDIIDSYETSPGYGLPMGNQTSQWFAIYYLDEVDRLVKEELKCRYYVRYMDDFVIVHHDLNELRKIKSRIEKTVAGLELRLNSKTQIFPIKNGVDFLGFHFYLTETGKVVRKIRRKSIRNLRRYLKHSVAEYANWRLSLKDLHQVLQSYIQHMKTGHTWHLRCHLLSNVTWQRDTTVPVSERLVR